MKLSLYERVVLAALVVLTALLFLAQRRIEGRREVSIGVLRAEDLSA